MSCNLSKILKSEEKDLSHLSGKILGIDIMPTLYKYLYTTSSDPSREGVLSTKEGVITSHLKGVLNFLKNLKKYNITPVICLDLHPPQIKYEEVKKRRDNRVKYLQKYEVLFENEVSLSPKQEKSYRNLTTSIGPKEKELILDVLKLLGISLYFMDQVEAEKGCATLKKKGIVDQIYSEDRDLILYQTSFYSRINFRTETIIYYDYKKILDQFKVDPDDLTLAGLAVGTDYSKGIPRVGPKTVFKLLKDKPKFLSNLELNVPNYREILSYLQEDLPIDARFFRKFEKNPVEFVKKLESLEFNQEFVLKISSFFFN